MVLAEGADRVVDEYPPRCVQQQSRECQALLLVQRQLPVPALRAVERGRKVAEIDPLESGAHGRIIEAAGLGGVAHRGVQRAARQIGSLRHEHRRLARRQLDRPGAPRPHACEGPEHGALA